MKAIIKTGSVVWEVALESITGGRTDFGAGDIANALASEIRAGKTLRATMMNSGKGNRAVIIGAYEYISVED